MLPDCLSFDKEDEDFVSCGCRHGLVLTIEKDGFYFHVFDPITGRKEDVVDIPNELTDHLILGMTVFREGR